MLSLSNGRLASESSAQVKDGYVLLMAARLSRLTADLAALHSHQSMASLAN